MATDRAPGVAELVHDLVPRAIAARATDVHFEPTDHGLRVRIRVDSLLHDFEALPPAIAPNVIARLKVLGGLLTYRTDTPQEGAIAPGPQTFPCAVRVASFPTVRGERVVLRLMANAQRLLGLADLGHDTGLVARLRAALRAPQGLLVICGPAGSGKTTTLYALMQAILAERPGASIFAVEDPVEIRLSGVTQVQIEPARGLTYAAALRSLLRQDPQVLAIGEVRDAEVAAIVVEAALTGHLLLTTMHSGSAAEAIVRLMEFGIPPYQLTSTLTGVLAQRLLRRCCPHCGPQPAAASPACSGTGYCGQVALGHFAQMTPLLRRAILEGADAARLAAAPLMEGSLRSDAERLLQMGVTTPAEVQRVLGT